MNRNTHWMRRGMATLCLGIGLCVALDAQQAPPKDITITAEDRTKVVERLASELNANYVFPEVAKKMGEALKRRLQSGDYDGIASGNQFAARLTEHLQAISKDKHLRVRCRAEKLPEATQREPTPAEREEERRALQSVNFGFEKIERLPGNVGYIDFRFFADPTMAGDTYAAAMAFLANTDALILDLRKNGGGDPAMVAFVCSYFFPDRVHLNSLYWRPSDRTDQFWTLAYVPGKRYLEKEVYVLTSATTFSGAEECTYNLKNLKRATIVGETTGGGAHPGGFVRLADHFGAFVPSGRAISPITKTNWEGTGVEPHLKVPADKALATAHLAALKKIVGTVTDPERKEAIRREIEKREKEMETPVQK